MDSSPLSVKAVEGRSSSYKPISIFTKRLIGLLQIYETIPWETQFVNRTILPLVEAECQWHISSRITLINQSPLITLRELECEVLNEFHTRCSTCDFTTIEGLLFSVEQNTVTITWQHKLTHEKTSMNLQLGLMTASMRDQIMTIGRRPIRIVNEYLDSFAPS